MASIDNIGFTLKTARESFNKSLFDLSKLTNLSVKQLTLLEENKFDEIGEGVFVIGFLRIYAKVLRINPNLIIESYRANYENISVPQSITIFSDDEAALNQAEALLRTIARQNRADAGAGNFAVFALRHAGGPRSRAFFFRVQDHFLCSHLITNQDFRSSRASGVRALVSKSGQDVFARMFFFIK